MPNELLTSPFGAASSYDETRGNTDTGTLLTVAASGTTNSADFTNSNAKGVQLFVNLTTLTGTVPTLTINLQFKDIVSGQYITILSTTALAATGFSRLGLYPGLASLANVLASDVLPRTWRVQAVTGGTVATIAATISGSLLV
jgi:hypothetical protein